MREVSVEPRQHGLESASLRACLATILELPLTAVPEIAAGDGVSGWALSRWLGGLGLGLAPIEAPDRFSWAGPWIARVAPSPLGPPRFVVMFGVPSAVVWDPAELAGQSTPPIEAGYIIAAADIATAMPPRSTAVVSPGLLEEIHVAESAGTPTIALDRVRAIAGLGLEGDRHAVGTGTFPSRLPGSALTLIEAEVCHSFSPPLTADEHRRNLTTCGIALNDLVGRRFSVGKVVCRGMRLCEPCRVVQSYSDRPVLRALVHRGGLRADILEDGDFHVGDPVRALD